MRIEIDSPPMNELGLIDPSLMNQMQPVVDEVVRRPRYVEPGRVSWQIRVGDDSPGGGN